MSTALILGDPGSGLTTFVGLLYTAQVRHGSDEADEFRFHADRESIQALMNIYGALGEGRFPDGEVDLSRTPLSFVFGFRKGRGLRGGSGSGGDSRFGTLHLKVGGVTPHDLLYLRDHDTVLDEPVRQLLRSPILMLLVDASWLSHEVKSVAGIPMARYDHALAGTLELLRKFLDAERDSKRRRMFPIFIVTKFDRILPEARQAVGAPSGPPLTWDPRERADVGQKLLETYLPETKKFFSASDHGKVRIEPPAWFFSSLRTEEMPDGEVRILRRPRTATGGWEPDYPYEEYLALFDHLRAVSRYLPVEPPDEL